MWGPAGRWVRGLHRPSRLEASSPHGSGCPCSRGDRGGLGLRAAPECWSGSEMSPRGSVSLPVSSRLFYFIVADAVRLIVAWVEVLKR